MEKESSYGGNRKSRASFELGLYKDRLNLFAYRFGHWLFVKLLGQSNDVILKIAIFAVAYLNLVLLILIDCTQKPSFKRD